MNDQYQSLVETIKALDMAIDQIKEDEGLRLKPYRDQLGVLTIGYGLNLDDGITQQEAETLMKGRIVKAKNEMEEIFPGKVLDNLNPSRKAVIINMLYNLGLSRFMSFKNMIHYINVGNFKMAAAEMLDSKWAEQVGDRANRLSKIMEVGA